jgi:hypothetical protein
MTQITGHMVGLYNLVADFKTDTILMFSDIFEIKKEDIKITLRRTDISAQVIVEKGDIKKKCGTKIIFIVNRLDEYESFDSIQSILQPLSNTIKIKGRRKKLSKIQSKVL